MRDKITFFMTSFRSFNPAQQRGYVFFLINNSPAVNHDDLKREKNIFRPAAATAPDWHKIQDKQRIYLLLQIWGDVA